MLLNTFTNNRLVPLYPSDAREQVVTIAPNQNIAKGTVLGQIGAINAVQTITLTNTPTGGTFTLSFGGQTTAAIAYNASAAVVKAALALLSTIGSAANLTVTGTGPYVVTFLGALAGASQTAITGNGALLTGAGAQPAVTVAQTTVGVLPGAYTPYASTNTDGSQVPLLLATYDMQTDANGNITFSNVAGQTTGNQFGVTDLTAPAYKSGQFRAQDLVGLDANAITLMNIRVIEGSLANGVVYLP